MSNLLSIEPRQHLGFVFFVLYSVFFVLKIVSLYVFLKNSYQLDVWQRSCLSTSNLFIIRLIKLKLWVLGDLMLLVYLYEADATSTYISVLVASVTGTQHRITD